MSIENLEKLFAAIKTDQNLHDQVISALDINAIVGIAINSGFDITVYELMRFQARATAELTDDQLANVAGGISPWVTRLFALAVGSTLTGGTILGVNALSD